MPGVSGRSTPSATPEFRSCVQLIRSLSAIQRCAQKDHRVQSSTVGWRRVPWVRAAKGCRVALLTVCVRGVRPRAVEGRDVRGWRTPADSGRRVLVSDVSTAAAADPVRADQEVCAESGSFRASQGRAPEHCDGPRVAQWMKRSMNSALGTSMRSNGGEYDPSVSASWCQASGGTLPRIGFDAALSASASRAT